MIRERVTGRDPGRFKGEAPRRHVRKDPPPPIAQRAEGEAGLNDKEVSPVGFSKNIGGNAVIKDGEFTEGGDVDGLDSVGVVVDGVCVVGGGIVDVVVSGVGSSGASEDRGGVVVGGDRSCARSVVREAMMFDRSRGS